MSDLDQMAPAELTEAVLEMLRESDRPMSVHAAAEAMIADDVPRSSPKRSEKIHAARRVVGPTLAHLAAAGRVIPHVRGSVLVYSPLHATPDIEARVNLLEKTLGGRVVSVVAGGTDPVIEITAPLSRVEAIGR